MISVRWLCSDNCNGLKKIMNLFTVCCASDSNEVNIRGFMIATPPMYDLIYWQC